MIMEKEIIHILCATDAKYASRLGVTLLSLFDNNRSNSLFVHVFVNDIHASIWNEYHQMAESYGQQLEIIEVPLQTLLDHGAFELWYFSYAIYYRLLALIYYYYHIYHYHSVWQEIQAALFLKYELNR